MLVRAEGEMAGSCDMFDSPRLLLCLSGDEPVLVDWTEILLWETFVVNLGTMPRSKAVCDCDRGVGAIWGVELIDMLRRDR